MKILIFFFIVVSIFSCKNNDKLDNNNFKEDVIDSYFEKEENIIVDSNLSFEESIKGIEIPNSIRNSLCILDIKYYGYDSYIHQGQLVVTTELAEEIREIFEAIFKNKFPINKVVPIVKYNWSDSLSMADNNTSCFNYRTVKGTNKLSDHSYGRAIDINPLQNPYIHYKTKEPSPIYARYDCEEKGTIIKDSVVVNEFKSLGWNGAGNGGVL